MKTYLLIGLQSSRRSVYQCIVYKDLYNAWCFVKSESDITEIRCPVSFVTQAKAAMEGSESWPNGKGILSKPTETHQMQTLDSSSIKIMNKMS